MRSVSTPRTALLALAAAVAALRIATLPRSFWEFDELLFAAGIRSFEPQLHHPHPPGYPLLIGLGKAFTALSLTPFQALVAIAVLSSLLGAPALAAAIRRLALPLGERTAWSVGIAGAVLFHGSAAMLVQGALPMSDPPALLFLTLALWCAGEWLADGGRWFAAGTGFAFSAAVGCRPQLAVAVVPALLLTVWLGRRRRGLAWALAGFVGMSLAWFLPLLVRLGGLDGLYAYQVKHASAIADRDLALWRQGWSRLALFARFVAHPFGPSWIALPMLLLSFLGGSTLVARRLFVRLKQPFETAGQETAVAAPLASRFRPLLPALLVGGAQLAFCLAAMEPADGVRYALPVALVLTMLAAPGAAALGAALRRPALGVLLPALLVGGSVAYTAPFLVERATVPSPPAQALAWAHGELPANTVFFVERGLAPHAAGLLADRFVLPLERALDFYPELPQRRVYFLLEGDCPWGAGRTFAWAPHDAFGKLTRNHYGRVSLCELPPARRFLAAEGVSPLEIAPPNVWWWVGERATLVVRPLGAERLRLRFHLPEQAPLAGNRLVVAAAGRVLGAVRVERGATREAILALPAEPRLDARLELTVTADSSFVPAADGASGDHRRLAVELLELELLPGPGAST